MRFDFVPKTVAAGAVLMLAQAAIGQAPAGLPAGPGHDTMVKVCSACHAPEIAATQRLDAAGWNELVETMIGRGAQATDAEVAEIKAYLTKAFPPEPAKAPAAKQ